MTQILEAEAVLARVGHDLELYQELVNIFFESYQDSYEKIREAISKSDTALLTSVAHTMKGALANLGAARAQEVARKLEAAGHSGTFDGGEELVNEFGTEIEAFRDELKLFLGH
jgi:HPt (histidine-containing phosphotransfer) domain-containing protein